MDSQGLVGNSLRVNRVTAFGIKAVLAGISVLAFALGWFGFTSCCTDGVDHSPFEAGLLSLQLFVLNVSPDILCNGMTRWAAVIAPLSTLGILLTLSHRVISFIKSKLLILRPPAEVYLGSGKIATSIALQQYSKKADTGLAKSKRVVFVDDCSTPLIQEYESEIVCSDCHWFGNAMSEAVLNSVNVQSAEKVWVLTGDDKKNIRIARLVAELRRARTGESGITLLKWLRKAWCYVMRKKQKSQAINVHVLDQNLLHSLNVVGINGQEINYFSLPSVAARVVLLQNPPKLPELDAITRRPKHPLHIAMVGDGSLIEALIERAVVHFVYSECPADSIRITIFSEQARKIEASLRNRIPHLDDYTNMPEMESLLPIADIRPIECPPENLTLTHWKNAQQLNELQSCPFSAIYVSDQEDINTITWAIRAASLREMRNDTGHDGQQPIYACLSQATHEHGALDLSDTESKPEGVHQIRIHDCLEAGESYPGESRDAGAMLVNLSYNDSDLSESTTDIERATKAEELWIPLQEEYRNSSRCAADHAQVKVACLYQGELADNIDVIKRLKSDLEKAPTEGLDDGTADITNDVMFLMRLEHRRFIVERLLEGWIPISPVQAEQPDERDRLVKLKKDKYRLNPTLTPFENLESESEKRKDRRIVEITSEILTLTRTR